MTTLTHFDGLSLDLVRYLLCFFEVENLKSYPGFDTLKHDPIFRSIYLKAHFFETNVLPSVLLTASSSASPNTEHSAQPNSLNHSNSKQKKKNHNTIYHLDELADIGLVYHKKTFLDKYHDQSKIEDAKRINMKTSLINSHFNIPRDITYLSYQGEKIVDDTQFALSENFCTDLLEKYLNEHLFKIKICQYDTIIIEFPGRFGSGGRDPVIYYLDISPGLSNNKLRLICQHDYNNILVFVTSHKLPPQIDVFAEYDGQRRFPFRYFSQLMTAYNIGCLTITLTENIREQCIRNCRTYNTFFIDTFDGKDIRIKLTDIHCAVLDVQIFEQCQSLTLYHGSKALSKHKGDKYYSYGINIKNDKKITSYDTAICYDNINNFPSR